MVFDEEIPCGFVSLLAWAYSYILWTAYQIHNLERVHGDNILLRPLEDHKFRADFVTNIASDRNLSDDEAACVIMIAVHLQIYIFPTPPFKLYKVAGIEQWHPTNNGLNAKQTSNYH